MGSTVKRLLVLVALALTVSATGVEAQVAHVKSFGKAAAGNTSWTYATTFTPNATGDAVVLAQGCSAASSPTVTLSATGWTITTVAGPIGSSTSGWLTLYKAYAPNTSAATFSGTSTVSCAAFEMVLIDEFSGADATNFVDGNGTSGVGFNSSTATTGGCSGSVTPTNSNDGIWFACMDSVTGEGTYSIGGNDANGDIAEWKIISGGAGVSQASGWTSSGAYSLFGVAIKPAGGGGGCTAPPNQLQMLGVGNCKGDQ